MASDKGTMKAALLKLLEQLEVVEAKYDGLGDTNVREHMHDDIWRGFLVPVKGFEPGGKYGLEPAADGKVAAAIVTFCKAANKAAKKERLSTFRQRATAFQDHSVRTKGDAEYEDYFGHIPLDGYDEHGNRKLADGRMIPRPQRLAWTFQFQGTIDEMCNALKSQPEKWEWYLNRNYREPFIDGHFNKGVFITIEADKKRKSAFLARMKDQFKRDLPPFGKQLFAVLKRIGAKKITEVPGRA